MYNRFMLVLFFALSVQEKNRINHLIPLVNSGSSGALGEIYSIAGGHLLSVAMGLCRNMPAAEDVLQDSLIKVVRFSHRFTAGTNGYAWLCSIVRNTAFNKIKAERLRQGADIDGFFSLTDGIDLAGRTALSVDVERALKGLQPKERTVVWLKYFNDMTVRDIAAEIGIPRSTAADIIKKAEIKLKQLLKTADK